MRDITVLGPSITYNPPPFNTRRFARSRRLIVEKLRLLTAAPAAAPRGLRIVITVNLRHLCITATSVPLATFLRQGVVRLLLILINILGDVECHRFLRYRLNTRIYI
uniref:Uncharacterized protein n=1 Tax=Romanomermis culicivorax TaxID=13658 RepID=A0A915KW12_ROMCU